MSDYFEDWDNLPMGTVLPPTASNAPYPCRVIEDKENSSKIKIAPDNDRGRNGEAFDIPREDFQPLKVFRCNPDPSDC